MMAVQRMGWTVLVSSGAALALLTATAAAAAPAARGAAPAVTQTRSGTKAASVIQLSGDPYKDTFSEHKTEVEPDVASHGSTIVAGWQTSRVFGGGSANAGWATSLNGGSTWQHGFLPSTTSVSTPKGKYTGISDTAVAYNTRYKMWLMSWLGIMSNGAVDVDVSRSPDGVHWGAPIAIAAQNQFFDKDWITCDNTATSKYYGNCYAEYDKVSAGDLVTFSTSADGGRTWRAGVNAGGQAHGIGGQPVVQPDGRVIVPIEDLNGAGAIGSVVSTDGGAAWSAMHTVASLQVHNDPANIRSGSGLPSAGIDASGRVYVVWSDCRFESSCSANDIVMSTSADGATWTAPVRIPADKTGSGADLMTPGLGVDPATSGSGAHLALTYYYFPDTRCSLSTCQLEIGFTSSVNGGKTWSAGVHIAGPMKVNWLASTSQGYMAGDYIATTVPANSKNAWPLVAVAAAPSGSVLNEYMATAAMPVTGGTLRAVSPAVFPVPARHPATGFPTAR
jgi:hypothetical protein